MEHGSQLVGIGLLQATSLSLPVVGGGIGVELGLVPTTTYAALVAAGLVSVLAFPLVAVPLLVGRPTSGAGGATAVG